MKILTIVLTFLCFQPFTAQAEMLDMSGAFDVAAVRRMNGETANDQIGFDRAMTSPSATPFGGACVGVQYRNSIGK